jgi:HEAT repeat protein
MESNPANIQHSGIDVKALAALIIELNIARRNFKSYPKGHPVIEGAFQKVISHYNKLLETQSELTIGIAKDALMFGNTILEKTNLVYRDFARVLFEHGIGVLTMRKGLTTHELENFNIILGLKREEINRHGGIDVLWEKARITSLAITAIRYDLFGMSADEDGPQDISAEGIWERFTRGMMSGSLGSRADISDTDFKPETLAALLNERFEHSSNGELDSNSMAAIAEFMRQECSRPSSLHSGNMPFNKLAEFIGKLNPNLRRQFLSSTFDIEQPDGAPVTSAIVEKMPAEIILDTLQDLNQSNVSVPPVIMGLLQKLSQHTVKGRANSQLSHTLEIDIHEKMRTVFKEHASEEFVPDSYQQQLNTLVTDNQTQKILRNDISELLATVESNCVENRISDIILNLVTMGGDSLQEREFFLQNLSDMFGYFLQIGDYGQLVKMIDRTNDDTFPIDLQYYLRENYARREFLDEILNGLTTWGKPRYNDIKDLITKIRSPFIEVLLDHLATEENMSLRRFIMDRLIEMGPATRVPISIRLNDDRWFVLRNLIIILRAHSDVSIIPLVRPLTKHSNIRVRHEALSTLVMLHDAASEKQVLRDLDSEDREIQLAAVSLAEKSRLTDIHNKLLFLLSRGGLTQLEYETKSAVVKTLGELHRPESLPGLAKILASSSLFNNKILTRLKIDIIRALENFPLQTVTPLIERIANGRDEIALQAQETLKNIKAKANER